MTFRELNLHADLLEGLEAMGFETATPIQELAIPKIMKGEDLIGCAQTGTGKTAAFLLPVLDLLLKHRTPTVNALILVPTRELAIQIDRQLEGLGYFTGISNMAVYGGKDGDAFSQEKKALSQGADILVATPGRLIAHLNQGYVKFDQLQCLILDEADRMLDMGFVADIQKIISYMPKKRQTLLFSATMPNEIRKFSQKIMKPNPETVSIAISKPAENVLQGAYKVHEAQKLPLLENLLTKHKEKFERILIFTRTKAAAREITASLVRKNFNAGEIHSDLDQDHRNETLNSFKNGTLQILVATDILSRGIDVKGIELVINYDMPGDPEDYIHRIGRTARADAKGTALTFIMHNELRKLHALEKLMEFKVPLMPPPPQIAEIPEPRRSGNNRGRGGRRPSSKRAPRGRGGNRGKR